jgi:hypothetical protein
MKIVELLNKINVPITNEESDVLGKFYNNNVVRKKELSIREQVIANNLVNKDILKRKKHEGQIIYQKAIL